MKERQHITINIAGESFQLDPTESTATIREIEHNFNKMWSRWCEDFRSMSKHQVLAMVAFQYARYYHNLSKVVNDNEAAIVEFERQLDDILLNVD